MAWNRIVKLFSGAVGAAAGLMGEWSAALSILAAMMLIDYLTGVIVAWRGRSPKTESGGVSSRAGFDGLIRKAFIMLVIFVATLLDVAIGNATRVFQTAATLYYIANEGISILENAGLMGVPCPAFIARALEELRQKSEE